MIRRLLRNTLFVLADLTGLNALWRKRNATSIRVLMYHSVTSRPMSARCWTVLSAASFEKHMGHLARYYHCLTATEMISALSGDTGQTDNGVFITFDDGLKNNATEAEPILARHSLTACCFVCPGLSKAGEMIWADSIWEGIVDGTAGQIDLTAIGGGVIALPRDRHGRAVIAQTIVERMKSIPHEERQQWLALLDAQGALSHNANSTFALMSLNEIKAMAERGTIDIGSHTMRHPILSMEPAAQQEEEISGCRKALEEAGIRSFPLFVYPNGRRQDYTDDTVAIVRKSGFAGAFTSADGLYDKSADIFQIPRIAIGNDTNVWEFKAKMSGFYYTLKRLTG